MTDPRNQAKMLLDQANALPFGPTKVALLEEAVQLADSVNDIDLAFQLRQDLMCAALFSGRHDITLVAFAHCLAEYDRYPTRFDQADVYWKYKWAITSASNFPEVSRSRLEGLLTDMERRYRAAGSTMHAVHHNRRQLMLEFGNRDLAKTAHVAMRKCRRDRWSDCAACVASDDCEYYSARREWGRAVQSVKRVLEGKLSCVEEPHKSLSRVLIPLLNLKRLEDAKVYCRMGYRLVRTASGSVGPQAKHFQFKVLTGEMAEAKGMLERHLPGALEGVEVRQRFEFLLAARLWTDCLVAQGKQRLKIRLPKGPPEPAADGKVNVIVLGDWLLEQAREIARRFDDRNGTSRYQQRIDELPQMLRLAMR